jgi:IclR family transcriptional regulator, pca regulon regulatory protein
MNRDRAFPRATKSRVQKTVAVKEENPRDFVRALARGLTVIESFEDVKSTASLSEIAARAKLSRGTVRRALMTLQSLGYLTEEHGRFSLLPRTLRLGYSYLSSQPLWALARPYVEEVHAQTGENTSLCALDDNMIVYLIRITASRLLRDNLTIGSRLPAYPASMGRVLLAGLPEPDLERYLRETKLKQLTPLTVIDRARLRVIIRQVRKVGYAVNDQEMELGLRSIAVPVSTRDGTIVAALNIATSSVRTTQVEMERNFLPVLKAAAGKISELLAHTGLSPRAKAASRVVDN